MRTTARIRRKWADLPRMARIALLLAVVCMVAPAWCGNAPATAGLLSEPGPTFQIAAPAGDWSVIAYGDMRFTDPSDTSVTNPTARRVLVARVAAEKPDALLLSGDVPYNGGEAKDYAVFREETAVWRTAGLRVFPAMGNHELHGSGGVENWWKAFPELRGRRWYSVEFGEAYFITLDSNLDLMAGGPQSSWLAKQLEGLPKETRYVFVSLHHPPVADPIAYNPTHNVRPNERALAGQLEEAAKHTPAKIIVIAGHIHAYQRFKRGGVIYLVSGGGGAAQHRISRSASNLYQNNVFPNFHYVRFVSEHGTLKATMYRLKDTGGFEVSDKFVVNAPANDAAQ